MFENVQDAIAYIESRRNKRSIDEFRETLNKCRIPMKQKNMIHIAGTNGKGSTVNYLRSILNAHGYKVGTFTSPYLICHNDRIRVDDVPISDEDLLYYINKYYDVIEEDGLSMFEIDVLIMLAYFETLDLDYRIIETGIGGLHDKTNVIDPIISVITNIGMDHQKQLGESIYDIINEKMGIIKPHQMFITSETKGTILARLQEQCDAQGAMMYVVPEYQVSRYPFHFRYRDMAFTLENQGIYQVTNARLALTIASKLIHLDSTLTTPAIENASWKGRYETLPYHERSVEIDGAHNVPGIKALIQTLRVKNEKDISIIFSCLTDKDITPMLDMMLKEGYTVYLTTFNDERAIDLSNVESRPGLIIVDSFMEALKAAYVKKTHIVITGSLHFISRVRKYLIEEAKK
ncbi:MAG: Mur ligase family protein [Longibaculum muris]|uniref:tetrahydrofolate synthase n=1 Tax=Longibaculum muris TaxID=1796628 RepID=A0A4R3Z405_9FIRM|nr:Mur ligase family protein [Longibaculum muris]MBS5370191.1 FolC protein [Coprobacillus cateniformis]MCR1888371.1 Mur ligase family protein [Longibaculum muris]MED9812780.1 Mur ligase family protein [Longibaculum muris]TCW00595.1 dihydrofolate synthase/folylpolyglutamate synthase [Longibaculum muris]